MHIYEDVVDGKYMVMLGMMSIMKLALVFVWRGKCVCMEFDKTLRRRFTTNKP